MELSTLQQKAAFIRLGIMGTVAAAQKGHIGGALSCTDLLTALFYGDLLKFDSQKSDWDERDRFILSKGHVGVALFVVLADLGFFPKEELSKFNQGSLLGEHPDKSISGIEVDSGSLGHGLGIGTGMALATKMDQKTNQIVVLMGDGECYEGSVWEAALFAAHHQLQNLTAIIDRNQQVVNDFTENINRLNPLKEKWEAFGWDVREIDGHSFPEIKGAFCDFRNRTSARPLLILANTIKGKGVSFIERQLSWHHGGVGAEEMKQAREELSPLIEKVTNESI